jgi:ABC transport system ATP-binding/permease protein
MPILLLSIPGQPSREVKLERGPYRIGREAGNDIVLESPVVSRKHGVLELRGDEWVFTDLNSRNGSFMNGERVHEVTLREGTQLQLGKDRRLSVGVTFRVGEIISKRGQPEVPANPSTPLRAGVAVETFVAPQESTTGLIELASVLPQGQKPLILGRGSEADIRLPSPSVSRRHARLSPARPEWTLVDLNSTNGTFVNGRRVGGPVTMKAGDTIQIGSFRLAYEGQGVVKVFAATRGLRLDGQALNVIVGRGAEKKHILEDVSISCYPQEFIGLVGGSGAGKTTLMKTLSGLLPPQGHVLVEGEDLYRNYDAFRSQIGYVPQDDILHKELTVEQALRYSARLRLPSDIGDNEVESRVNKVLEQVELAGQRSQPIHSLSGGQRKRASIAVELLADPPLFFLDEPTSGLDPGLEKKMMVMLGKLADSGKTILLVTHATANITECDQVAFMSQGKMVYFGPPNEADQFFEVGANNFASIYDEITDPEPKKAKAKAASWAERFRKSVFHRKYVADRFGTLSLRDKRTGGAASRSPRARANPLHQFMILAQRYFSLILRDRTLLIILLAVMPLLAFLILGIAEPNWLTGDSLFTIEQKLAADLAMGEKSASYSVAVNGQKLLFIMALTGVMLGLFSSAYEIVKERTVYRRERMVFLQLIPYLASKVVPLGAFAAVQCLLFVVVIGSKVTFPEQGVFLPFFMEMYLSMFLGVLTAIGLGLFISSIAPNQNTVTYIVLGVLFLQITFAGVIFQLPGAARSLSSFTLTRWTMQSLGASVNLESLNDLSKTRFQPDPVTDDVEVEVAPGQNVVKSVTVQPDAVDIDTPLDFELDYQHTASQLLFDWSMLIVLFLFFGACTIVALKRQDVIS